MKNLDDAAIRLGLALYQRTLLEGENFYKVYDLVFDEKNLHPRPLFLRVFFRNDTFWGEQEEAAKILDSSRIAQVQRQQVVGSVTSDYGIKLTPFGRKLFEIAYLQSDRSANEIHGLTIEDLGSALSSDVNSEFIANELRNIDESIDRLELNNFQRSLAQSYVNVLIEICFAPDRDVKLFWLVLDRLNQFAGVASLIVAIIALRVSH